jgi:hypothetical protein
MTQQLTVPPPTEAPNRWTTPIRVGVAITAAIVLFFGVGSVVAYFMIRTTVRTAFFVDPVQKVRVNAEDGDVVIRTGTAKQGATVVTRSQSSYQTAEHSAKVTNGVLQVSGGCRGNLIIATTCSVNFEITVAPGTVVEASTSVGDISVQDTGAAVTASSSAGSIWVSRVGGPLRLSANVGDIRGDRLAGGIVSSRASAGDVRLNFATAPDQIQAVTEVGDVRVLVPDDDTAYRVTADVDLGDRHVDVPTAPDSEHVVHLKTSTGDVRINLIP